ncbi:MAG: PadR family transcriptional regulator [Bacilli bacterium]|nr:PadR family transcriptional regulator [Bacilli bacterium]
MNTQFKKGVLELIVLCSLAKRDMYGYELTVEISKVVDVNDGTIYPLLKRLTNEKYFDTYLEESTEGPPRKYYHINEIGKKRKRELTKNFKSFMGAVSIFIEECEKND